MEIGPGTGNLTEEIIKNDPRSLTVIEKDEYLCEQLNFKFKDKIHIINNDVLKENINKIKPNKKFTVF